jgi:hypothetical protein
VTPGLARLLPALPALAILWFGGVSFLEKYPRSSSGVRNRAEAAQGPDSLLALFRLELSEETASPQADSTSAPARQENPFRPIRPHRPRPAEIAGAMRLPPPPRDFHLKGTVGREVATLVTDRGQKHIVKKGDRVDSAEVVSIEPNKVILRDRAGRFELHLER